MRSGGYMPPDDSRACRYRLGAAISACLGEVEAQALPSYVRAPSPHSASKTRVNALLLGQGWGGGSELLHEWRQTCADRAPVNAVRDLPRFPCLLWERGGCFFECSCSDRNAHHASTIFRPMMPARISARKITRRTDTLSPSANMPAIATPNTPMPTHTA